MKLIVNNTEVDAGDKRLTLICHPGDATVRPVDPAVAVIDPAFCQWAAQRLHDNGEWDALRNTRRFQYLWALVWKETPPPENLGEANEAMRHTAGLILGTVGAIRANKQIMLKFPETYLHPGQQSGLADLVLELTKEESE